MALDIDAIEQNIVAYLSPPLMALNASVGTTEADALNQVVTTANVFVNYAGMVRDEADTFNRPKIATFNLNIVVRVKDLRSHKVAFPICEKIRELLEFYAPTAAFVQSLRFESERIDLQFVADGIWLFIQDWTSTVLF